jgi:hypothetical protein
MPMQKFVYHGQVCGFDADIWEPGPHKVEGHARCAVRGEKSDRQTADAPAFEIPGLIKHGGCSTVVHAMPEDKDNFFRTEVTSTLKNLNVENGVLTADEITLGIATVYGRHWFDNGKPHARRVRVAPYGCKIVNLRVHGVPIPNFLPAPFQFSKDRCDAYLHAPDPDAEMEAEIRDAIASSPSRFLYVKNFGRIFFGEWTLLPSEDWHPIHQISMVRMALGSPQTGGGTGSGGQGGGGTPGGPG